MVAVEARGAGKGDDNADEKAATESGRVERARDSEREAGEESREDQEDLARQVGRRPTTTRGFRRFSVSW